MSSRRGRGFADTRRDKDAPGTEFERLKREERLKRGDPAPSIEGWVVIVTGLHDEVTEEDVRDKFADCGMVKDIRLDMDRETGFVLGYALVEYGEKSEAEEAIRTLSGTTFMGRAIYVNWAFRVGAEPSFSVAGRAARRHRKIGEHHAPRSASSSPERRR